MGLWQQGIHRENMKLNPSFLSYTNQFQVENKSATVPNILDEREKRREYLDNLGIKRKSINENPKGINHKEK